MGAVLPVDDRVLERERTGSLPDLLARAAPGSAPDMTKADMEPESADAKSEPAAVEGS